ncbi:MAG: DoxX family membrane protein [Methylococcaceae bacterium]
MAFQQKQRQFLAYLKNPKQEPLPEGFAEQGSSIYVDLLYNKFNDSLLLCFPITHSLLGEIVWQQTIKDFIALHHCQSPYYRQIPDEFMQYLQTQWLNNTDYPYLIELAHFEWVELILAITEADSINTDNTPVDNWLDYRPVFAPVLQLLHYNYPVHRINADYQSTEKPQQATQILAFRDNNEDVQFIELSPATARLIEILCQTNYSIAETLQQLARELQHPQPELLFNFAIETLKDLMQQGAIVGLQKNTEQAINSKTNLFSDCDCCPVHFLIKKGIVYLAMLLSTGFEKHTAGFAPLLLRLLLAYEFLEAGLEKVSGENWFAQLSFPFPFNLLSADVNWVLSMSIEIIAPIALILGFATRFFSFSLIILTLVAIISVHLPAQWHSLAELAKGYVITDQGYGNYKLPLMYLVMLISLLLSGSGQLSIDNWLTQRIKKYE